MHCVCVGAASVAVVKSNRVAISDVEILANMVVVMVFFPLFSCRRQVGYMGIMRTKPRCVTLVPRCGVG